LLGLVRELIIGGSHLKHPALAIRIVDSRGADARVIGQPAPVLCVEMIGGLPHGFPLISGLLADGCSSAVAAGSTKLILTIAKIAWADPISSL
jgi:hypothetical protein